MTNRRRTPKVILRTGKTGPNAQAPIPQGKVRCPGCGRPVGLTTTGRLNAHNDRDGISCPMRWYGKAVELTEMPAVEFPLRRVPPERTAATKAEPVRVVTGHCHTCDRLVSGERLYCGPCLVKRGRL